MEWNEINIIKKKKNCDERRRMILNIMAMEIILTYKLIKYNM